MPKQILISLALLTIPALAQTQPPDCPLQQAVLTSPSNLQFDNRSLGCDSWTVFYIADTGATVSLVFQSTNGQSLPGTWATYTGNTSNSSSSFGTAVSGIATYCGLATCVPSAGVTVQTSWVRVHVATLSGGTLRVFFYGYRTGYGSGLSGGGGGGGSGCPNPCPVTQSTSPWVDNITQWASTVLGAATGWGVAPSGNVPGMNANVLSQVQPTGLSSGTTNQQTATSSGVALPNNASKNVCIHGLTTNAASVWYGFSSAVTSSTGDELPPGYIRCMGLSNSDLIFIVAPTGSPVVSFTTTN